MKKIGKISRMLTGVLAAAVLLSGCGASKNDGGEPQKINSGSNNESQEGNSGSTAIDNKNDGNADNIQEVEAQPGQTTAEPGISEPASVEPNPADLIDCSVPANAIANASTEFAANLKLGWNLGNTLDALGGSGLSSETAWGQPMVTQELMTCIANNGFTTIRIPVSWGQHTDSNYNIDEAWMARVTEVVDWALDAGLYVIINSHHDNDYYYPSAENFDNAKIYLNAIWTQIADNFSGYDERLIFESMNEPRLSGTNIEWWFQSNDSKGCAAIEEISILDQIFVNTVRAGENYNTSRYLMVSSYAASPDFTMHNSFTIPGDPAGRILISVHAYTPYDFAMHFDGGYDTWDGSRSGDLGFISRLNSYFVEKGYGVVIGEFGATNKDNIDSRVAWAKEYTAKAASYGIASCIWDNGGTDKGDENFGLIDRYNYSVYFPELLEAYKSGYAQ